MHLLWASSLSAEDSTPSSLQWSGPALHKTVPCVNHRRQFRLQGGSEGLGYLGIHISGGSRLPVVLV